MKRISVTEHIDFVTPGSMKNFTSCSGVIVNSKGSFVIDTNMGSEETVNFLTQEKPDIAVISHYHLDHSTWGRDIAENTDAEILIPRGEENYLTDLEYFLDNTAEPFGLREQWREFTLNTTMYRPIEDFSTYSGGGTIDFGGVEVQVIATPGHSPRHSSFYFPEGEILFTGDMGIDRFGPWYGWIECDLMQFIESILRLKGMKVRTLLTSHGGIVAKDIPAAFEKILTIIADREKSIVQRLEAGMTKEAIIEDGVFYGRKEGVSEPMRSFLIMWDCAMFDHHVTLVENGGMEKMGL